MSENRTTIVDIIAKLRKCLADGVIGAFIALMARKFADRIEAAYNNEMRIKDEEIERLKKGLASQ